MGFSLCMMADFENALISRIFGDFWSVFLQRMKMLSFLEYLVFLEAVFCREQL